MNLKNHLDVLSKKLFGRTRAEAHAAGVCIRCGKPPGSLEEADAREYSISALCPTCWDEINIVDDEEDEHDPEDLDYLP